MSSARQLYKARWGSVSDQPATKPESVTAPAGSLRAKLQEKRGGQSAYGDIASRFMENPVEVLALLSLPLAGPMGTARSMAAQPARSKFRDILSNLGMQYSTNPAARAIPQNLTIEELARKEASQP